MSVLSCVSISKVFQDNGYEALRKISLEIGKGEAVGIVGESGSGKSTLGNIIGGLEKPTDGTVFYHDNDISQLRGEDFQSFRRSVQYIPIFHSAPCPFRASSHQFSERWKERTGNADCRDGQNGESSFIYT